MSPATLTTAAVLEAFDRWNDGNPGPAYGRVVLYAAHYIPLEELVRAALLDQGLDPDRCSPPHPSLFLDIFGHADLPISWHF
jgi:hypothetical protein